MSSPSSPTRPATSMRTSTPRTCTSTPRTRGPSQTASISQTGRRPTPLPCALAAWASFKLSRTSGATTLRRTITPMCTRMMSRLLSTTVEPRLLAVRSPALHLRPVVVLLQALLRLLLRPSRLLLAILRSAVCLLPLQSSLLLSSKQLHPFSPFAFVISI